MKKTLLAIAIIVSLGALAEYQPEEWNLKAREVFDYHRFGIFIHWGLYANYAQGEWYLQQGYPGRGAINEKAYSRMMYGFYPSKFDAKEWVKAIKGSGAKYLTITSRHHDGFSLWPTKVDDGYNIANTPFKRDILGELADECKKENIQLNFYYSLMDWHRKDYPAGESCRRVTGEQKGDYASYKKFMLGQIGELIDWYHPGCIWFDGEWEHAKFDEASSEWKRTLDWEFDDIYDFIHSKKVLVANNNHQPIREKEDIQLFERNLPGEKGAGFSENQPITNARPIEQCDVVQWGVWGYRIFENGFRTPEEVVSMLAKCSAKGVNLLLNVGPDGSGQFPEKAVEVLKGVGEWMEINGSSIYWTKASSVGDGKNVVATSKDGLLFLHFLNPEVKEFSFETDVPYFEVEALDDRVKATLKKNGRTVKVTIERPAGYKFDIAVKLLRRLENPFPSKSVLIGVPKKADTDRFCDFIRNRLKKDGVDTLFLRVRYDYQYKSHPECATPDATDEASIKKIVKTCRECGIKLIPKLNALGHQTERAETNIGGPIQAYPDMDETPDKKVVRENYCRSICPKHPKSLPIFLDLGEELMKVCESDSLHIGCDEVFEIGECPRCKNTPTWKIYADWINALNAGFKKRGMKQMYIWADRMADPNDFGGTIYDASDNGTLEALGKVDKDIILCDWHYWPNGSYRSIDKFRDAGYKTMVCVYDQPDGAGRFVEYAKEHSKGSVIGLMLTSWTDCARIMDSIEGKAKKVNGRSEWGQTYRCYMK